MPKLKVLHIGNVANYAYNIGKVLQTSDVASHAINWDYYHINAQPIWEEGDFDAGAVGDQFFPVLPDSEKAGFRLPGWYVNGPRTLACLALIAANEGMPRRARLFGWLNTRYLRRISDVKFRERDAAFGFTRLTEAICLDIIGGFGRRNTLRLAEVGFDRLSASLATKLNRQQHPLAPVAGEQANPLLNVFDKTKRGLVKGPYRVLRRGAVLVGRLRCRAQLLGRQAWHRVKWPLLNFFERLTRFARRYRKALMRRLGPTARVPVSTVPTDMIKQAPALAGATASKPGEPAAIRPEPSAPLEQKPASLGDEVKAKTLVEPLPDPFEVRVKALIEGYSTLYPERGFDPILLRQFKTAMPLMRRLFAPYDVVVGYAVEGIWPLLAGRPYVAYEFGTIRNLPFEDSATGRLASLVYRHCEQTIVTNSDNEAPAKRLGRPYFFLPHIINESGSLDAAASAAFRAELIRRHGGDFFVFHPPRQHWDEARDTNWDKGNDHLFRGFAELVRSGAHGARCIAVAWGQTLEKSKHLVEELGITEHVIWITPQPHVAMMRYVAACDVVCDQFTIPTFGGIPPKAFHAGRPVVTAFDPGLHSWCFAEMPPLLPANSAAGVAEALIRLHGDPQLRHSLGERGAQWYRRFNSNARVLAVLEQNLAGLGAAQPDGKRSHTA